MTRVEIDGETYACPFAGVLRPHTPAERVRMLASVRRHGIKAHVFTYLSPLHGRALVDGIHRATYGRELGVEVPLFFLGAMPDSVAKELALSLNLDRRQLTPEEEMAARGQRVARVVAAVTSGAGIRETARAEGVSHVQVLRDIKLATGGTCVPRKKKPAPVRAYRAAQRLDKLAREVNRARLAAVAESYGCPVEGKDWPALRGVVLTLRDLSGGAVSA